MSKIFVFGHKNPDTDTICSAIAYAKLKRLKNFDAQAVRLGEINPETEFALKKFGVEIPEEMHSFEGKDVILVDHTEIKQSADDILKANIIEIIDHHNLGDIYTRYPVFVRIEPIGSTSTIIFKMFRESNLDIDNKTAGLLLSGILSDTVILRSVTCTDEDRKIAKKLADQLNLDLEKYGFELKKAKSDISSKTDRELIKSDLKIFNTINMGIGQVEIVEDIDEKRKKTLLEEMEKIRKEIGCDTLLLMLTNIIKQDTELLVVGKTDLVEKAFKTKVENNRVYLKGVMSRKKQVKPVIEDAALL
ncbi:MAG: manganese-dependent inorganic pyrophosphatase [Candidatus Aenigmarchaeota archaeon]|nr:manganese-dependent inorganic pyrophosphatase [Candidatus Aenigmarchaeota archaeon]